MSFAMLDRTNSHPPLPFPAVCSARRCSVGHDQDQLPSQSPQRRSVPHRTTSLAQTFCIWHRVARHVLDIQRVNSHFVVCRRRIEVRIGSFRNFNSTWGTCLLFFWKPRRCALGRCCSISMQQHAIRVAWFGPPAKEGPRPGPLNRIKKTELG